MVLWHFAGYLLVDHLTLWARHSVRKLVNFNKLKYSICNFKQQAAFLVSHHVCDAFLVDSHCCLLSWLHGLWPFLRGWAKFFFFLQRVCCWECMNVKLTAERNWLFYFDLFCYFPVSKTNCLSIGYPAANHGIKHNTVCQHANSQTGRFAFLD